jgi:hypothetical protein
VKTEHTFLNISKILRSFSLCRKLLAAFSREKRAVFRRTRLLFRVKIFLQNRYLPRTFFQKETHRHDEGGRTAYFIGERRPGKERGGGSQRGRKEGDDDEGAIKRAPEKASYLIFSYFCFG